MSINSWHEGGLLDFIIFLLSLSCYRITYKTILLLLTGILDAFMFDVRTEGVLRGDRGRFADVEEVKDEVFHQLGCDVASPTFKVSMPFFTRKHRASLNTKSSKDEKLSTSLSPLPSNLPSESKVQESKEKAAVEDLVAKKGIKQFLFSAPRALARGIIRRVEDFSADDELNLFGKMKFHAMRYCTICPKFINFIITSTVYLK